MYLVNKDKASTRLSSTPLPRRFSDTLISPLHPHPHRASFSESGSSWRLGGRQKVRDYDCHGGKMNQLLAWTESAKYYGLFHDPWSYWSTFYTLLDLPLLTSSCPCCCLAITYSWKYIAVSGFSVTNSMIFPKQRALRTSKYLYENELPSLRPFCGWVPSSSPDPQFAVTECFWRPWPRARSSWTACACKELITWLDMPRWPLPDDAQPPGNNLSAHWHKVHCHWLRARPSPSGVSSYIASSYCSERQLTGAILRPHTGGKLCGFLKMLWSRDGPGGQKAIPTVGSIIYYYRNIALQYIHFNCKLRESDTKVLCVCVSC